MIKQILYYCEADCTVLIRKPQVISGGVRTPCTLPLDPPLQIKIKIKISTRGMLELENTSSSRVTSGNMGGFPFFAVILRAQEV